MTNHSAEPGTAGYDTRPGHEPARDYGARPDHQPAPGYGARPGHEPTPGYGAIPNGPTLAEDGPAEDRLTGDGLAGDGLAGDGLAGDGLAEELAGAAPRRRWNRGTVVLAAMLLAGGAFLGGAYTQQHYGQSATTAQPSRSGAGNRSGQFPGGYFQGGAQPGAGAMPGAAAATPGTGGTGGGSTTGTVKLVDGSTVYVQTPDGKVITVRTTTATDVRTAKKSSLDALRPGDTVTVQGSSGGTDTLTATSVTGESR